MTKIRFENIGNAVDMFIDGEYRIFADDRVEAFWMACNIDPATTPEWADDWLEENLPPVGGPTDEEIKEARLRG